MHSHMEGVRDWGCLSQAGGKMSATEYVEKQSRGGRSDNSTCFL